MIAKIEIPKGYRKLRKNEIIKLGDYVFDVQFYSHDLEIESIKWSKIAKYVINDLDNITKYEYCRNTTMIRRINDRRSS